MKKSINAWSIPGNISFEEMFRDISSAGYEGIELNIDKEDASRHSLSMHTGKAVFDEINALSEKYNLPVASISTSLFGTKLGSDDAKERESGKDIIRKQLECAASLGADGILVVPGGMTENISLLRAHENSFKALEELKTEIDAARINVGLENVWNTFFLSPFDMAGMIDRLDSKYIGAYFDVGNVIAFSNAEYWIEILDKRIKKIHVKDFKRNTGVNRGGTFVNLLEGDVDWVKVIRSLREAGYDGYLTAELGIMQLCPGYLYDITSKALDVIINLK